MKTIWGESQAIDVIADGIIHVTTAGHGGFILNAARMKTMPAQYKACSYTKDNNFEEDTSWCGVVLAWPDLFDSERVDMAQKYYEHFYLIRNAALA